MEMLELKTFKNIKALKENTLSICRDIEEEIAPTKVETIHVGISTVYTLFFRRSYELDSLRDPKNIITLRLDEAGSVIISRGKQKDYDAIPVDDILELFSDDRLPGCVVMCPEKLECDGKTMYGYTIVRMLLSEDDENAVRSAVQTHAYKCAKIALTQAIMHETNITVEQGVDALMRDEEFEKSVRCGSVFVLTTRIDPITGNYIVERE